MIRRLAPTMLLALALVACGREQRVFRPGPADTTTGGQNVTAPRGLRPSDLRTGKGKSYEENAYHLSRGRELYRQFNCVGCHANGGGDVGPAFFNGVELGKAVTAIRDGLPNGMPAYGERIPEQQIWQIAAYVRSMSGALSSSVAPNRSDRLNAHAAENRAPP